MKKIKILTLIGNNYGGSLQAYALYSTLKKYNINVSVMNYMPFSNKRSIKDFIKNVVYIYRNNKFIKFRNNYMNLTKKSNYLVDDLESIYIVGSDQVWNPAIDFKIRENYYLKFVKDNNRKNSYAASIGADFLDKNQENINKIKDMLSNFNYLTVREQTANRVISSITNKKIDTVLDPTLLLTQNDWKKIVKEYNVREKYIFVYTLGLNKSFESVIDLLSKNCNLKIVDVFYKKRFSNELKHENGFGPIEFVSCIAKSELVVTNSFHGTVFSLLFHKNFITITRGNMNSRIYDLLKKIGLEDRIVSEDDTITKLNEVINKRINYKYVDKILNSERNKSLEIIKNIINS